MILNSLLRARPREIQGIVSLLPVSRVRPQHMRTSGLDCKSFQNCQQVTVSAFKSCLSCRDQPSRTSLISKSTQYYYLGNLNIFNEACYGLQRSVSWPPNKCATASNSFLCCLLFKSPQTWASSARLLRQVEIDAKNGPSGSDSEGFTCKRQSAVNRQMPILAPSTTFLSNLLPNSLLRAKPLGHHPTGGGQQLRGQRSEYAQFLMLSGTEIQNLTTLQVRLSQHISHKCSPRVTSRCARWLGCL